MKSLLRIISLNSFVWLAVGLFVVLLVGLALGGLKVAENGWLAAYLVAIVALGPAMRTPPAKLTTCGGTSAAEAVLRGPRPSRLDFLSDCAACARRLGQ